MKLLQLPGTDRFSPSSGGGYNDTRTLSLIIKRIEEKSKKFLEYPSATSFKKKGLFISTDDLLLITHPLDVTPIHLAVANSIFDIVFIHQPQKIIVVCKDNAKISEHSLSVIEKNNACCEAMKIIGSKNEYDTYCERARKYKRDV